MVRASRTQLRDAVRAEILDAAEELIALRGLHGAALAQIARRAGIAVGTLYNYFTDRDAMIRALFESRRATLIPAIQAAAAAAAGLPFEPRLRQFTQQLLKAFESHRRFVKVAIETEHFKVNPSTTSSEIQLAVDAIVADGVAERAIYKDTAPLVAMLFAGAVRSIVLRRTADGGSFVDDGDAIVSVFLDGARRPR